MPVATITSVMESWPLGLRLRVEGEHDDILIDLADDCLIVRAGHPVEPGELRPGMRVQVPGPLTGAVDRVEVL